MMRGLLKLYRSRHSCKGLFFVTRASFCSSASLHSVLNVLSSPKCDGTTTTANIGALHPWSLIQHRGVKVNAIHLRPGNVIEKSGRIYQVVEVEHRQRGRGGAMMQIELRDVDSGTKQNSRFGTEESVERVFVQEKSFACLYTEDKMAYLMDPVNFEQLEVPLELFGKAASYLKEDLKVKLQLYDDRPLSGSVPKQVTCSIKETLANMKGTTVTPRYVKAVLDNGLTVQVPSYLQIGEKIIINTEDDTFVRLNQGQLKSGSKFLAGIMQSGGVLRKSSSTLKAEREEKGEKNKFGNPRKSIVGERYDDMVFKDLISF